MVGINSAGGNSHGLTCRTTHSARDQILLECSQGENNSLCSVDMGNIYIYVSKKHWFEVLKADISKVQISLILPHESVIVTICEYCIERLCICVTHM